MGNTEAGNSKPHIYIETEKQFYNSGSIIQGVVFVDATSNHTFDALYIRVEGDEYCQWFEGSSKNRRKYTGVQNFYAVEHMLCKYNNMLPPGKYAYPFSLQLSENIPGTFITNEYDARVDYKLIAYFSNFQKEKLKSYCSIPLMIRQPFRQEQCEYEGRVTQNPKNCWCFKKGQVKLQAQFSTNVCYDGQQVEISLICDNTDGKSNINKLSVDLVRYTFVSANNGFNKTYKKVIKTQHTRTKVPKGTRSQRQTINFRIGNVDHQTAISTLVANYYRLEAYVNFGNFATSEPCIYSPMFIMKRDFGIKRKIKNPPDFSYCKPEKRQIFKAPQYWFRKNKNLEIMNFRLEDNITGVNQSQNLIGR